jgi:hypothetical protein
MSRTRCCPPGNTRGRNWPSQYSHTLCCMSAGVVVWGTEKGKQICAICDFRVVANVLFSLRNLLMRLLILTYRFHGGLAPNPLTEKEAASCTRHRDSLTVRIFYQRPKKNSGPLARQRTIPTERPPLVGEISANFSEQRVSRGQRNESPRPLISVF